MFAGWASSEIAHTLAWDCVCGRAKTRDCSSARDQLTCESTRATEVEGKMTFLQRVHRAAINARCGRVCPAARQGEKRKRCPQYNPSPYFTAGRLAEVGRFCQIS